MPNFSSSSKEKLETCHPSLQLVLKEAIKHIDFTVVEGYRDELRQNELFRTGFSRLRYPESMHNKNPSMAVDIAPYPIDWEHSESFCHLAGFIQGLALQYNVRIRWGGDWDMDGSMRDQTFMDLGHLELVEKT